LGRVLVVDPSIAGASGDMLVAALLDLVGDQGVGVLKSLGEAVKRCCSWVEDLRVAVEDVTKHGFRAKRLKVELRERGGHRHGGEILRAVECASQKLGLSERGRGIALAAIRLLLEAEASIHGSSAEEVHLHEAGSADTVIDVVGSAALVERIGDLEDVYVLPVAVGGGRVRIEHGLVPAPAPATLELLRRGGLYTVGGPVEKELATPTGVALIVAMGAKPVKFLPPMRPLAVGYGAGAMDLPGVPNVLRVIVGEGDPGLGEESVVILETDVDDVTGEVLGHVIGRAMDAGALDISVIPSHRKKGRPGYLVRVLVRPGDEAAIARLLVEELGTLGVRVVPVKRFVVPERSFVETRLSIGGREFAVRVKVSRDSQGRIVAVKPEYSDLERVSREANVPLRLVAQEVMRRVELEEP